MLLTWALLTLPLAYLLRAATPTLIYLACIVGWAYSTSFGAVLDQLFIDDQPIEQYLAQLAE